MDKIWGIIIGAGSGWVASAVILAITGDIVLSLVFCFVISFFVSFLLSRNSP